MNTKHRRAAHAKRKYQADPAAIGRLMARIQPFTPQEQLRLNLPPRIAYERMRTGQGAYDDFHTLASVVNVCLVRGEQIDPLCVETAQRAQDALMRSLERNRRTQRWGFDGPALLDLPPVLDLYEQMLELSTPQQMHEAMRETVRRMNAGDVV